MIAEVCHFYGWTVDHVLVMPASRFFVMLRASRRMMRVERVHSCYISRASQMGRDDFLETVQWFDDLGKENTSEQLEYKKQTDEPLRGEQEKMAVMRAFAKDRRIDRTVHK